MTLPPTYQPQPKQQIIEGVFRTKIDGLFYLQRRSFADERGFFAEIAHLNEIEEVAKNKFIVKQVNHSRSLLNVVRGMHAEGWRKLVTVVTGLSFCALADVRPDSPTFKQVEIFLLGFDDQALDGSLFIEQGIANSLCVLKGPVDYIYAVDRLYKDRDPQGDQAISVFDPDLNIPWPIPKNQMILSDRDKQTVTLRQLYPDKF